MPTMIRVRADAETENSLARNVTWGNADQRLIDNPARGSIKDSARARSIDD